MDNGDVVCFETAFQQLWSMSGRIFHRSQQPPLYLCLKQNARQSQQYLRKIIYSLYVYFSAIAFIILLSFYFGGQNLLDFWGPQNVPKLDFQRQFAVTRII